MTIEEILAQAEVTEETRKTLVQALEEERSAREEADRCREQAYRTEIAGLQEELHALQEGLQAQRKGETRRKLQRLLEEGGAEPAATELMADVLLREMAAGEEMADPVSIIGRCRERWGGLFRKEHLAGTAHIAPPSGGTLPDMETLAHVPRDAILRVWREMRGR